MFKKICDKLINIKTCFSSIGEDYEEETVNPINTHYIMQQHRQHHPKAFRVVD